MARKTKRIGCLFDTLEDRRLMSVSMSGGVVRFDGTAAADQTSITYTASTQILRVSSTGMTAKTFKVTPSTRIIWNGGGGNDILNASTISFAVEAHGGSGNDLIYGSKVADRLYGGPGSDTLYGNAGDDYVDGGEAGTDSFSGDNDHVEGNEGNDTLVAGEYSSANIVGDSGNDKLFGGSRADKLYGGSGDDQLYGSGGDDFLQDTIGNDTFDGVDGNDIISCKDGNPGGIDTITTGVGSDSLSVDATDHVINVGIPAVADPASVGGHWITGDTYRLTWTPVAGSTGYLIQVRWPGIEWSNSRWVDGAGQGSTDLGGLQFGFPYEFRVQAGGPQGQLSPGAKSAKVATSVPTPIASPGGWLSDTTFRLNWIGSPDATNYVVQVSWPGQVWSNLAGYPAGTNGADMVGIVRGFPYHFRVVAYIGGVSGLPSNDVAA